VAAESRKSDSSLVRPALESQLWEEPFSFEFFQAVRLLERLLPNCLPVGHFGDPAREAVRFGAHASQSFPASEIQSLETKEGEAPTLRVNFMGLTGPEGVLPQWYTTAVIDRLRAGDQTLQDFLDIFNHRSLSFFYRAWKKYRFGIAYERGERKSFFLDLLALIGLGTRGLTSRQAVLDEALIFFAGLLGLHQRSAAAFEQLLGDYFEVPVRIEQWVGAWYPLDSADMCCLDELGDSSQQLGGAVLGDETWDYHSRVRIVLGPLTLAQYREFLPTGTAYEPLRALARFYSNDEFDFEVQLILLRDEVPRCELGTGEDTAPRLGWITWMKSEQMDRNPADTSLKL
jgi:type VI secretion system protein ImpH